MAAIVVAPATTFAPGTTVVEDFIFGDSDGTIVNTALAQTFTYTSDGSAGVGDADSIGGTGRGGNDRFTVTAAAGSSNEIDGDAFNLFGSAQGGDDRVFASGAPFFVTGDAISMGGESFGGNDRIELGASVEDNRSIGIGDAFNLIDSAQGGDDSIKIGAHGWAFGDAGLMGDISEGGNDQLVGRGRDVQLAGDAQAMFGSNIGGNDHLRAGGSESSLFGDVSENMGGSSQGGDDYLHNQAARSLLVGDGRTMVDEAKGGNDVLSGSPFADLIVGDGRQMGDGTTGGDDVLLGGKGNDSLWGDQEGPRLDEEHAGADRFVFGKVGGKDTIGDFQHGIDVIDLQQLGYTSIGQLTINETGGGDSIVHFSGINQVRVEDVTGLTAADFLFA